MVFNIKSDGQKKARLVAQGYSQVEGVTTFRFTLPLFLLLNLYLCNSLDFRT
jgi:hypothetical protein